jgi:hypothetical protein
VAVGHPAATRSGLNCEGPRPGQGPPHRVLALLGRVGIRGPFGVCHRTGPACDKSGSPHRRRASLPGWCPLWTDRHRKLMPNPEGNAQGRRGTHGSVLSNRQVRSSTTTNDNHGESAPATRRVSGSSPLGGASFQVRRLSDRPIKITPKLYPHLSSGLVRSSAPGPLRRPLHEACVRSSGPASSTASRARVGPPPPVRSGRQHSAGDFRKILSRGPAVRLQRRQPPLPFIGGQRPRATPPFASRSTGTEPSADPIVGGSSPARTLTPAGRTVSRPG